MHLQSNLRWCAVFLALSTSLAPTISIAETHVPYKIQMTRTQPDQPLRKSTIMGKVKDMYPGRILSIEPQSDRGPDCHVVKLMGDDGEFRIIHVACTK
ncbi:hypothetical protein [uncultured Thiothrix sp.]|jgi:hypothetical protein|uniref:hypothetical protein n=1 Tax=uncultured Thiothrix sp. TaxID=223185 RepID=UPI002634FE6B|nr:hypothetical protein [uncultured Thiothrix sp.]HMT92457.1 hypothetical protein [Thiolinea sp.]